MMVDHNKRYDVVGIGNAVLDIFVDVDEAFLATHGLRKDGMTLADEATSRALYQRITPRLTLCGGSVANTIVGLASLGCRCGFIGKVSDDDLGSVFQRDMRSHGVAYETSFLEDSVSTARCLVFVTPDSCRSMQTFLGASTHLSVMDMDEAMLASAQSVFLEGYLWSASQGLAVMQKAARLTRSAGGKVAFSLSDSGLVASAADAMRGFIADYCDIVFANESEARALLPNAASFDELCATMAQLVPLAVITRSEKGSVVLAGQQKHLIDAVVWKNVTDSTGAGDLYAAGFLYGLVKDMPLARCGQYGALCAAEIISHFGARPETALVDFLRTAS